MFNASGTGRFTSDPVLTDVETPSKKTVVCNFTLAIDEFRNVDGEKKKTTHFFDLEAWDSGARTIASLGKKGASMSFMAQPRQNKWTGEDGTPRSKVVFRVNEFKVFDRYQKDDDDDA